uniref:Uncharacterized protein n=1 Tax=Accipiter nisus TaxID=211598 RepID=A0A8B9NKS9_9AVES
ITIQDWGEEVEEGAVYHVTLKRVQIQQAANKGARWLGLFRTGLWLISVVRNLSQISQINSHGILTNEGL